MTVTPQTPEVLQRDLSPYCRGNTGIDRMHRFESGKPGPHVLVNALTHGKRVLRHDRRHVRWWPNEASTSCAPPANW